MLSAYAEGQLLLQVKAEVESELSQNLADLRPEEAAVLTFLEARLRRTLKDKLADSVALLEAGKGEAKPAKKASRKRKSAARKKPRAKAQSEARAA